MDAGAPDARIGPNAILQLVAVLDRDLGRATRDWVMQAAGQAVPPADAGMWPEAACRAVHHAVYHEVPDRAAAVMTKAGVATADYILAHRIPIVAQALIRALPAPLGARILTLAIARHAWTFVGSGRFRVLHHAPLTLEILDNPLASDGRRVCHWHAGVLTRLYQALVWPGARVEAVQEGRVSRFTLYPR